MLSKKHLQYGVAAIALGSALGMTASAGAQIVETDTMPVTILLESSFDLTRVTGINLGTVSIATGAANGASPTVGVDTANTRVVPANGDANNFFFVVSDTGLTSGSYTIANAAHSEQITIQIPHTGVTNPVNGNNALTIVDASILDTTAGGATNGNTANADVSQNATNASLIITTDANGAASFTVGATVEADPAITYADATYTGSMVINAHY